jgi:hypothetical protein
LSVPSAVMFGVPFWLAALAALVLLAMLLFVTCLGWALMRRTQPSDLPQAMLGLSHVIAALSGFLPWGRPPVPPALPEPPAQTDAGPAATQTVVVMRSDTELRPGTRGEER